MGKEALAFKTEFYKKEKEGVKERQIRQDLVSYLAEYRFSVAEFDYQLKYASSELVDPNTFESMSAKTTKAIEHKGRDGQDTKREEAEYQGFKKLEEELLENPNGTIVWFSPPGEKKDGYGDYGFVYVGEKKGEIVEMKALRLEKPSLELFNQARNKITGAEDELITAEEFLEAPTVVNLRKEDILKVLKDEFTFPAFENQEVFNKVIIKMGALIDYFSKDPSREKLFAIENIALEYKKSIEQGVLVADIKQKWDLDRIVSMNSYEPPKVAGSCGSTKNSNDIFKTGSLLLTFLEDQYGSRTFKCPKCGGINIRPENELLSHCQHCNSSEVSCE